VRSGRSLASQVGVFCQRELEVFRQVGGQADRRSAESGINNNGFVFAGGYAGEKVWLLNGNKVKSNGWCLGLFCLGLGVAGRLGLADGSAIFASFWRRRA
jgi:hypothetical protein